MNELLFIAHAVVLVAAVILALKMGKYALTTLFALQAILANLFVIKQMKCFGLTVTCSDVYAIGALLSLNLLQEHFGKKVARKAIWVALFTSLVFIVMAQIHLYYRPSEVDATQMAFETILRSTPRLIIASIAVAFIAERLDIKLYHYAKTSLPRATFSLRFSLTALVTQLFDTVAFSFAGLYGLVHSMVHIICLSYLVKVALIVSMAPLSRYAKRWAPQPVIPS